MDYFFDLNRLPSFLVPFVTLSYPVDPPLNPDSFPDSSYYDIGYRDACLIVTLIAIMAILRDASRLFILEPFANWKLTRDWRRRKARKSGSSTPDSKASSNNTVGHNVNSKFNEPVTILGSAEKLVADRPPENSLEARRIRHAVMRFAEQGWQAIYYMNQWSLGMVLPPLSFSLQPWAGYPHIPLAGIVKLYYLLQISLYVHAVLLLNAEAARKDHWQMMTHHVVTIFLIVASYYYGFTRVGCLIMVIMDWCDIFLPLAKMLRYLSYQIACDVTFVWWMLSWFFGWRPERGYWLTKEVHRAFVVLLVLLELIQSVWSYLILGVAYRVLRGEGGDDPRSDDEGEEEQVRKDR
ncbi:longevity assurance proteins LAG1/LAC1 [Lactarius quietus]|nr:longevity assurance proteins LAG1/LAC1 [Lactarius quietus]